MERRSRNTSIIITIIMITSIVPYRFIDIKHYVCCAL